jgi:hypothetical protein
MVAEVPAPQFNRVVAKVSAAHCATSTGSPRRVAHLAQSAAGTVSNVAATVGLQYDGSLFDCWVTLSMPPGAARAAAASATPGASPLAAAMERLAAAKAPVAVPAGAWRQAQLVPKNADHPNSVLPADL